MAVVLRLARAGAKKKPYYHVVATDSRNPRDGKFLEAVGSYDPNHKPAKVEFAAERLEYWLKSGAVPSETVGELIKRHKRAAPAAKPA
ncbi:MAG TPA: 30S ribosomal protein S16 [Archangium sp.]|uniref:30S ribosomal protein S16 n=1 Tax=Archangium sp. TaxID=1872627 RepID=UPI002E34A4D3|nr:30S ribosomal protein S16 [Archangium sp.]HEX5749234.1 30S ribosomal protein S16 [Archangium sp.]